MQSPFYIAERSIKPITLPDINAGLDYGVPPLKVNKPSTCNVSPYIRTMKPKKPRSAYIWFALEMRPVVSAYLGRPTDYKLVEIELGKQWTRLKKLPYNKDLLHYQALAKKDILRYKTECIFYEAY